MKWRAPLVATTLVMAMCGSHVRAQEAPARRIVSLAPHLTELAFTAGAGDRIIATIEYSNHPAAARKIARIGDAFHVDLERLVALKPDAVLVWESGTPLRVIERIRALNLRVISFQTHRLDEVATTLRSIGKLTGTSAIADAEASRFEREIAALRREYRERAAVSVFIQINNAPLYTVNGRQIMSELVELCGGRNVFAQLNELAPAIGLEAVVEANPQVILSTDDTVPDAAATWKKWTHIQAVRASNVYTLPSDDFARATTRLSVGARQVCRTLDEARRHLEMKR
jgi:iron complex transport system substrate-binding protein